MAHVLSHTRQHKTTQERTCCVWLWLIQLGHWPLSLLSDFQTVGLLLFILVWCGVLICVGVLKVTANFRQA